MSDLLMAIASAISLVAIVMIYVSWSSLPSVAPPRPVPPKKREGELQK